MSRRRPRDRVTGIMDDFQQATNRPASSEAPHAPAPPTPPRRLPTVLMADERQFRAWLWVTTSLLAFILLAVSVPLAATIYCIHLMAAFGTSLALAGALPLTVRWPWVGAGLATVGLLAFALLSASSDGAPWRWPVPAIVGEAALLIVLGVMRESRVGFAAWGAAVAVTLPFA